MAQEDYFLKIDGIKGESQDDKHKDEIHCRSFSFGVTNAGTGGSNLGSGGGSANMQDMHFTKTIDKSSPNLFMACATGKHFATATLTVRKRRREAAGISDLQADRSVYFVHQHQRPRRRRHRAGERSLNFSKVEMTYTPQNADGTPGAAEPQDLRRQGQQGELTLSGGLPWQCRQAAAAGARSGQRRTVLGRTGSADEREEPIGNGSPKGDRLAPPLMYAFRAAHREARRQQTVRTCATSGERVIAARRRRAARRYPRANSAARSSPISSTSSTPSTSIPLRTCRRRRRSRKSVLNFGFPDLSRRTIDENGVIGIAREIETALTTFEPGLSRGRSRRAATTTVSPMIESAISRRRRPAAEPIDVPVEFVAEVELDSGKIKVDRL